MILHGYWRSTTSYRTRIALALKGVVFDSVTHDLRVGAQSAEDYVRLNPQGLVPALQVGDQIFTQSLAILEWLEECYPTPSLLPASADDRAVVRAMSAIIGCDMHPLNNLRVQKALRSQFNASQAQIDAWAGEWNAAGFDALERLIQRHGGLYAFGDQPTLADCCLIPQVYSARRFKVDLSPYPRIGAVVEKADALPAFQAAHPDRQPDADPA